MKTYDCFLFFNELDLLELRLQELWDTVDCFIIVESNSSHSGNPKPYILLDNWDRYEKYHSKIHHVKVEDMPNSNNAWDNENHQRNAITHGLTNISPDDIIIISDLDEIPRAEMINMIKEDENDYDRYLLCLPQFRHRINYMKVKEAHKYSNIMVTRARSFTNPQQEREYTFFWNRKPDNTVTLEHGGWHFTYFGDDEAVKHKLQNFAHTELNIPEIIDNISLDNILAEKRSFQPGTNETFEYVVVDDYFPDSIINNLDKWQHLIIPNATVLVTDIYIEE
jgi:hypothetical protein